MKFRHYLICFLLIKVSVLAYLFYQVKPESFSFPEIDFIGHFLGFFFLTFLIKSLIKLPLFNLAICLIVYSALTEVSQYYLGFRNGEFRDFIADALGIGLFVVIYYFVQLIPLFTNKTHK